MNVKLVIIQLLSTRYLLDTHDKINRSLELCDNYLDVYTKVSPGYAKWRGHILELKSKAMLKLAEVNAKEEVRIVYFFHMKQFEGYAKLSK